MSSAAAASVPDLGDIAGHGDRDGTKRDRQREQELRVGHDAANPPHREPRSA